MQLVFVSERDGELKDGTLNLYMVGVDTMTEQAVRPFDLSAPFEGDPRYAANGKQVAIMARQAGQWIVMVMDVADDGAVIRESAFTVTVNGDVMFPVWRP
jgi:Tol biopolymer transport system component